MNADEAARWRERVLASMAYVARAFDERAAAPAGDLALAFEALREIATAGRRPRVAAIGRRGAAKSSLLNAIANEPRAELGDVEDATRVVRWTPLSWGIHDVLFADTPGLRASGRARRVDDIVRAFAASPPDVLLVLCHATEVDAGIDDDLHDVRHLMDSFAHRAAPSVFGIVTRVDELDPPHVLLPPFDDDEKQTNIARAVDLLRFHLERRGIEPVGVIPVSTYVRFDVQGRVRDEVRWNVETLVREVSAFLPDPLERHAAVAIEMRALLHAAMTSLTDVLAERVARTEFDDVSARDLLVRAMRGLAPYPARAGEHLDDATERAAPLGWASDALAALGAERWSASAAGARVRSLGHALRDRLLSRVGDDAYIEFASTSKMSPRG